MIGCSFRFKTFYSTSCYLEIVVIFAADFEYWLTKYFFNIKKVIWNIKNV